MGISKVCPHCGEIVDVEDGHSSWICPNCKNFFPATPPTHNED